MCYKISDIRQSKFFKLIVEPPYGLPSPQHQQVCLSKCCIICNVFSKVLNKIESKNVFWFL